MNFNFELILFWATVVCGVIALIDVLFLEKNRRNKKMPWYSEYARSFFPILLIVFCIRSFLFEPFRIPSGSLKPTLDVGDFILVNKYHYGVRLPVIHTKLLNYNEPKRGDIIVFRWPPNPSLDFIKRVIGVPGDHVSYIDRVLYINGEKIPQIFQEYVSDKDESGFVWTVSKSLEDLFGVKHEIYQTLSKSSGDFKDKVVPEGMYFVMGDNRDDSADSRYWGFVPEENIVGKASFVWMSWNGDNWSIRWKRLGKSIH